MFDPIDQGFSTFCKLGPPKAGSLQLEGPVVRGPQRKKEKNGEKQQLSRIATGPVFVNEIAGGGLVR